MQLQVEAFRKQRHERCVPFPLRQRRGGLGHDVKASGAVRDPCGAVNLVTLYVIGQPDELAERDVEVGHALRLVAPRGPTTACVGLYRGDVELPRRYGLG